MKFGIALQWSDMRHLGPPDLLVDVAQTAQRLGFHSLWTTDQLSARSATAYSIEPLIAASSLIHVAPEMDLGVAVLVLPLRHAAVVAKQAATLSLLSNGRFVLGVGVGGIQAEYDLVNEDLARRGRKADEAIDVMQRLWTGAPVTVHGEFHDFADAAMAPRPPPIPVWIGGGSPAAIRRAARVGDGWVPALHTPDALRAGVSQIRALRGDRPLPTIATMEMVYPGMPADAESPMPVHLGGPSDQMIAALRAYEAAGLDHLICSFVATDLSTLTRQMHIMAADVMPDFSA